jgi:hypothetical protein
MLREVAHDDAAVAKDIADNSNTLDIWDKVWPSGIDILAEHGIYYRSYSPSDEDKKQDNNDEDYSDSSDESDSDSDE